MNRKLLAAIFLSLAIITAVIIILVKDKDAKKAQETIEETTGVESVLKLNEKWSGDFDEMSKRNLIRALVPFSKTFYFLDGGDQRGLTYDLLREFENYINRKLNRKTLRVRLVVIPTRRDRLLPALMDGTGDIAAGNLTIIPERQQLVDFSDPLFTGIDEIIVAGPAATPLGTIDDLAGKKIYVRASSSYYESLKYLNRKFKKSRKKHMKLVLADEYLEDEDLLEMMNANLIPMIVIDSHKGKFWKQIFKNLNLYPNIKLRSDGKIAWAIRKGSPKLKEIIDRFIKSHKEGTTIGNLLKKRYLQNVKWVRNSLSDEDLGRFKEVGEFFRKYSDQYGFDWLMIAAIAYQESGIDQNKQSPSGAIGVMQILPNTASGKKVNIPDIDKLESNIHAGIKYLRIIRNEYFEKEPMDELDKMLFTFASYNAGPNKVKRLRKEALQMGLDPNVWFRNVEVVAARRIGRETVQYVSNIYKYYIAYKLITKKIELKKDAKKMMRSS
ncbi:MAG: lytic transglycosylase F [Desulfobacterales bacterium]|nr:MAG: lytic transglycosylase F [Desulfobacterales bacterium]